jgi:8-oxo-dGTP pyrophosphatase MutT (NUDIX family)
MKQTSLSSGAIPLKKVGGEWRVLLLRSFKYWDFPKGMVEEGEDPLEAAKREVQEETGLSKFKIPFKNKFIETEPYGKGKVARYYLFVIEDIKNVVFEPNPITGIVEHHEHRWVTFEDAHELLVPRVQKVLKWGEDLLKR